MCRMCDEGKSNDHTDSPHDSPRGSRRNFLKASTATAVAAAGLNLLTATPAAAQANSDAPSDSGKPGRRYIIRGGSVMSMDPSVGDFAQADVLIEGKKIIAIGHNLQAGGATPIDARGRIVLRGATGTHRVRTPRLWSAEDPALYTLVVTCGDESAACRVGFRTVEVRDGLLLVNGAAVRIHGVNRHDHDDRRGRAVTPELMELDARVIKQHNLNAVRCSHYPNDP